VEEFLSTVLAKLKSLRNITDASDQNNNNSVTENINVVNNDGPAEAEGVSVSRLVSVLKGNWYTTVEQLAQLTSEDAEMLGISPSLYHAIQLELPSTVTSKKHHPPHAQQGRLPYIHST
jgi:hypothetical protein